MGDRETEGERETVRLLVGRGETPAEEGGHGLPGATYTHLDLSPRGCVCCERVPTCESARAFLATYVPSRCRLARRRPCSCRKGTCVKR